MWLLRIDLRSSGRAARALNQRQLSSTYSFVFKKIFLHIYLIFLHVCVHVCNCRATWGSQKRALEPPATELTLVTCQPWELNSSPLQEQSGLLPTKLSLQPLGSSFLRYVSCR